ncbi:MAG: hypothetical protein A2821_01310 [Candidatus Magasanikbacteria bacterium RIFCSPHIGHO2_01_FULL_41_23]|uniref:Fibronectin type-III domain-containing protein n=1 Tax=Candidatus Magasanikbacteria bacterium RIFCSPLOWO2_01_FULL_40_15 TaxID=1798686 RepID=A0A1F6N4P6_9BACT|nr:MAG: hypothetical protein A2821_01310 [Candidatus Magasanikbacteria bacterium RIFCSPHIGHO2_01_FULL_41_23]OGH66764.1 MAG: hypothetical protein A3C66_01615 [Candidatus Magasanikbacteria bacterium RIFCSPHIGHO2_02_FULL_41_35]OGH74562.1 MAG: hypothetical protein A3F22_03020 [Candidatus Magasanikbacteria bacterium RIFCSPHIGHO2_12_FULL_41_16]OGH78851.1 MAG: hypothetical protein A2983_00770 [Candidatus Magasanikbacteria bacterium RIFCSPLOWO2_01_FULL_40_15]
MLLNRKKYRLSYLASITAFITVCNLILGPLFFSFESNVIPKVKAAAVTWVAGATGTWETGTNWSSGVVPTTADDVTISSSTGNIVVTLSTGQTANFASLIVGGDSTRYATTTFVGNIGTAVSTTIATKGTIIQKNTATQTLTGNLTIQSGGVLTHEANTTAQDYELDFSVASVNIQSGGKIDTDGKGYSGGASGSNGNGTGGGIGVGSGRGGGGAHGGDGGIGGDAVGGTGYCDISSPATIGSGGGGGGQEKSGTAGGGVIILNASGTATINGTITADGTNGTDNGGSGAGGGVKIVAGTITGTPESFTVTGGVSSGSGAAGGGGGCVLLNYTTSNSISPTTTIIMSGGAGGGTGYRGGAGVTYVKQVGTNGDLYSINSGTSGAGSTQGTTSLTVDSVTLTTSPTYIVPTGKTLVVRNSNPFVAGDATGILQVNSGATFTPTSTTDFVIASSTLQILRGSTITSSSSLDVILEYGGTLDMRYFTTSSNAFPLDTLYVKNGGLVTHGANTTTQAHVINLSFTSSTIATGGSINVDGKGYSGGASGSNGNGTGGGIGVGSGQGGGGAHAGAGGTTGEAAGGSAYCVTSNPGTLGSGGGGGGQSTYGTAGGGLVILSASGALTVAGTITAGGTSSTGRGGAGGAGGVKITADVVAGTPQSFITVGGNGTSSVAGGGGGCIYILYTTSNSIAAGNISVAGGTSVSGGGFNGGTGNFTATQNNSAPTAAGFPFSNASTAQTGTFNPTLLTTTTPSFSALYIDSDASDTATKAHIQMSTSSSFTTISHWDSGSSGNTITSCTQGNRCQDLKYGNFGTAPTTNLSLNDDADENSQTVYYWRLHYFDTAGAIGSYSTTTATFTLLDIPNEPSGMAAGSITASAATLSWTDNSSIESNYLVQVSGDGGTTFATATSTAASATSITTSTLSANTSYLYRVAAQNSVGTSTYSTSSAFYTLANIPTSLTIQTTGVNGVLQASWSANSNPAGTSYYVEETGNTSINSGLITDTSYTFSGLTAGQTYTFHVKARNGSAIDTAYTDSVSATLPSSGAAAPSSPPAIPPPPPIPFPFGDFPPDIPIQEFAPTGLIKIVSAVGGELDILNQAGLSSPYEVNSSAKVVAVNGASDLLNLQSPFTFNFSFAFDKHPLDATVNSQRQIFSKGDAYNFGFLPINNDAAISQGTCFFVNNQTNKVCDNIFGRQAFKIKSPYNYRVVWNGNTLELYEGNSKLDTKKINSISKSVDPLIVGGRQFTNGQYTINTYYPSTIYEMRISSEPLLIYTNKPTIKLKIDSSYAPQFALKESNNAPSADFSATSFEPTKSELTWNLKGADGKKCVNARFNSQQKNFKYDTYACVILDTAKPIADFTFDNGLDSTGKQILLPRLFGVSDPDASITITQKKSLSLAAETANQINLKANKDGSWIYAFSENFQPGNYAFSVSAQDLAGNVSEPTTKNVVIAKTTEKPVEQPLVPEEEPKKPELPKDVDPDDETPIEDQDKPIEKPIKIPAEKPIVDPADNSDDVPSSENSVGSGEKNGELTSNGNDEIGKLEPINNVQSSGKLRIGGEFLAAIAKNKSVKKLVDFVSQEKVQKANVRAVVPVEAAIGVVNVAVGFQLPQLINLLRYLFGQPALLARRRKRKSWGVVYNSFSKLPVDLATIRLIEEKTGRVLASQVTDFNGRYFLSADQGQYRLEIIKPGFVGFSEHLKEKDEDTAFVNLYHGEAFFSSQEQFEINYNIPFDPVVEEKPTVRILRDKFREKIQYAFSFVGLGASVMSFVATPGFFTAGFVFLHIGLFVIFYVLGNKKLPPSWGVVRDLVDKSPIGRVVVRVFDSAYNKLVNTAVTDSKGRYAILIGPSMYYASYEKDGFVKKQTSLLDYSSQKNKGMGGIINRDEILQKVESKK